MTDIETIVREKSAVLKALDTDIFNLAYRRNLEDKDRPQYCLLPLQTSLEIITELADIKTREQLFGGISYANLLTMIGQWRLTKDIIRFDEALLDEICKTDFSGNLPTDVFYRMPAYCTYVEMLTPEYLGFFFALEKSAKDKDSELRVWWVDRDKNIIMTPIHLGDWTLETAMNRAKEYARRFLPMMDKEELVFEEVYLNRAINIILYLCSTNAEYSRSGERPGRPTIWRTKKGLRFFEADKPKIWRVGEATGQKLREQRTVTQKSRYTLKPHMRRAHWHGFWSGPKNAEKRDFNIKWLPPIFVGGE